MKYYLFLWLMLVGTAAASAQTAPPQGPFVLTLDEKNLILLLTKGEKLVAPIREDIRSMVDSVDLSFKSQSTDPRVQQLIDRFIEDLTRLQNGEELLNEVRRDIPQLNQNGTNAPTSEQNFRTEIPNRNQDNGGAGGRTDALGSNQFNSQNNPQNNSILLDPRTQNSGTNPTGQFSTPPSRSGGNMLPESGNPQDNRRGNDFDRGQIVPPRRTDNPSSLAQQPFDPGFPRDLPNLDSERVRQRDNTRNNDWNLPAGNTGSGRSVDSRVDSRNLQNTDNMTEAEWYSYRQRMQEERERFASADRLSPLPRWDDSPNQTQRIDPTTYDSLRATILDLQDQNTNLLKYLQDNRNQQARNQFTEVSDQDYASYSQRQASNRQVPTMQRRDMAGSIGGPDGVQNNQGVSTPPLAQAELEKIKSTNTVIWFMLLFSIGLNFYLAWLARTFYSRYADLADELRETFTASS